MGLIASHLGILPVGPSKVVDRQVSIQDLPNYANIADGPEAHPYVGYVFVLKET